VNGSPFIARLPEFIYSMDDKGVWINLYAASQITWDHGGRQVELITETAFPLDSKVEYIVHGKTPGNMVLRFRIPGWLDHSIDIMVNGKKIASGVPGTYQAIERRWRDGDRITMELPLKPRITQYTGLDQHPEYDRYALSLGPVLMALVGPRDLFLEGKDLPMALVPVKDKPLWFTVAGQSDCHFQPYWTLGEERMTCFPVMIGDAP
jgi:DUF1680 family protein